MYTEDLSRQEFLNEQVDSTALPSIDHLDYKNLHKDYLTAELMGAGIVWLIITLVLTASIIFNGQEYPGWINWLVYGVLFLMISFTTTITILGHRRKKYALRQRDIIYNEGLIWRSSTIVPFNRIQHAEVHQGPIERLFDLGNIKIFTAGGSASDLSISGITYEEAQNIKYFVLNKTALDEEE